MSDSTITIKTQEYQTMNEVIELQRDMNVQLKKDIKLYKQQVETLESLIECKNSIIEYYEIENNG